MFGNAGVTVLCECLLLNDRGEKLISKVSSQKISLDIIFSSMTTNFTELIIMSCFLGSKVENKSLHRIPRKSKCCAGVEADGCGIICKLCCLSIYLRIY